MFVERSPDETQEPTKQRSANGFCDLTNGLIY